MPQPSSARLHEFRIVSNDKIADDTYALVIEAPALAAAIKPGQFMNFEVPGNAMSLLRIPLSYARADADAGTVEIWYAVVGEGTERLSQMQPGDTSTVLGPGGHGWSVPEGCSCALLVGGGIGVPPLVPLAEQLHAQGVEFDVCLGAKTATAGVGGSELDALGAHVIEIATDDGTDGHHGFVTDPAAKLLDEKRYDYVATCGPGVMMSKVAEAAAKAGAYCEASLERMMSCGFGACSTCNVETTEGMKGACMCGPVFDASKVVVW